MSTIADLFELFQSSCKVKYLSVSLYTTKRHFGVTCRDSDDFLKQTGASKSETAYKWIRAIACGNFDPFCSEHRDGKHNSDLYDHIPELEFGRKIFVL